MKIALSLLLILLTGASFAQLTFQPEKIRKQVLSLEQLLPAYNNTQLPTYLPKAYDTIFNCATVDELYELTNHPNPCVRRSAFGAMLQIETPKAFDLISKNAGDTTQWFYLQAAGASNTDMTYIGYVNVFELYHNKIEDGTEVYSLMRESELGADAYLDKFFDTGSERT